MSVNASGSTLSSCDFPPRNYSETISFIIELQTALDLRTNQGGKQKRLATFMKQFISQTHLSPWNPVLLVLDNHSSHISYEIQDICKKNWVNLLPFPSHCWHRLKSLDVSVYRSRKTGIISWLKSHPVKNNIMVDLPEIIKQALL